MPNFVQREVRDLAKEPSASDEVMLLVGYKDNESSVRELVKDGNGEVLESLPYRSLRIRLPETSLESLLDSSRIETVELDSGMETLLGN